MVTLLREMDKMCLGVELIGDEGGFPIRVEGKKGG